MSLKEVPGNYISKGKDTWWTAECPVKHCKKLNSAEPDRSFKPLTSCVHFQQLKEPGKPSAFLFNVKARAAVCPDCGYKNSDLDTMERHKEIYCPALKKGSRKKKPEDAEIECTLEHPHPAPHKPPKKERKTAAKEPEKKPETDFTFILKENGTKEQPFSIIIRHGGALVFGESCPGQKINQLMKKLAAETDKWARDNLKRDLLHSSVQTRNETKLADQQITNMFLRAISGTGEQKKAVKERKETFKCPDCEFVTTAEENLARHERHCLMKKWTSKPEKGKIYMAEVELSSGGIGHKKLVSVNPIAEKTPTPGDKREWKPDGTNRPILIPESRKKKKRPVFRNENLVQTDLLKFFPQNQTTVFEFFEADKGPEKKEAINAI